MDALTIKCRDLMYGDWCCDKHGFQWQIIGVGDDYAYATFEGNEGDPWEFMDKDDPPQPIEITTELLKANGWEVYTYELSYKKYTSLYYKEVNGNHLEWKRGTLAIWLEYERCNNGMYSDIVIPVNYVHQLQQVLRLAGMTDMANNFKV